MDRMFQHKFWGVGWNVCADWKDSCPFLHELRLGEPSSSFRTSCWRQVPCDTVIRRPECGTRSPDNTRICLPIQRAIYWPYSTPSKSRIAEEFHALSAQQGPSRRQDLDLRRQTS